MPLKVHTRWMSLGAIWGCPHSFLPPFLSGQSRNVHQPQRQPVGVCYCQAGIAQECERSHTVNSTARVPCLGTGWRFKGFPSSGVIAYIPLFFHCECRLMSLCSQVIALLKI